MVEDKAFMHRWFDEVWNRRIDTAIDDLLAPDCVMHGLGPAPVQGADGFRQVRAGFLDAFPDLHVDVQSVVMDGDLTAVRYRCTATHRGGGLGIAATGNTVEFTGMGFARLSGGRAVEVWNNFDRLTMLQQVGAVSVPG